jgi:Glyoxalase superfamily protein
MMFGKTVPILRIFDEAKAKEFYIGFLGFVVDWEHRFEPNTPLYMQVSKDECVLHLSEHYGDGTPGTAIRIQAACGALKKSSDCSTIEAHCIQLTVWSAGTTLDYYPAPSPIISGRGTFCCGLLRDPIRSSQWHISDRRARQFRRSVPCERLSPDRGTPER